MLANLNDYLKNLMVYIPEGEIRLRDFRNEQKWISSNYKFGMPGIRKNLKEVIWSKCNPSFINMVNTINSTHVECCSLLVRKDQ